MIAAAKSRLRHLRLVASVRRRAAGGARIRAAEAHDDLTAAVEADHDALAEGFVADLVPDRDVGKDVERRARCRRGRRARRRRPALLTGAGRAVRRAPVRDLGFEFDVAGELVQELRGEGAPKLPNNVRSRA